jgi:hypothetical protein
MCCCICGRCKGSHSGHLTRSRPAKLTNQSHATKFGICFFLFDQVFSSSENFYNVNTFPRYLFANIIPTYQSQFESFKKIEGPLCRWFRFAQLAKGKKFRP